jgi:thiol-disulfide isomerase/thioredoxin
MTSSPVPQTPPRRTFPRWLIAVLVLGGLGTLAFCGIIAIGILSLLGSKITPTIITATDGQSSVTVPATWRTMTTLSANAELQVGDELRDQYLIVRTVNKADIADTDLAAYSKRIANGFKTHLDTPSVSAPRTMTIDNRPAVQYEIHGTNENVKIMYLLTCVEGTQNYYEIVAWTVESKADTNRATLRQVSESFQEGKAAPTARLIYDPRAKADDAIAQALTQARADHKRVLLDFGADWCPDCLVLAQLFEDPQVKPFLDGHFHVVRIDVGQWDNNLEVAERYGDSIAKGIPAVVILDEDGQILSSTAGGRASERAHRHERPDIYGVE